ncbi:MAG: 3-hydroxyacyl-CoA dehydrogenase NAD-binding domain-containing protein, partial [Myxococcota bacterium]
MKKIGIIGTGTMGCGIAQVASQIRCEVVFQNRKQESVDRGLTRIQWSLDKLVSRDKLKQAQSEGIMDRIHGAVSLEELKGCDIVLESAPENLEIK